MVSLVDLDRNFSYVGEFIIKLNNQEFPQINQSEQCSLKLPLPVEVLPLAGYKKKKLAVHVSKTVLY